MSLLDDVSIVVTPNGYKAGELYAVVPVPTEGTEEVTNGDFATDSDWNKATGVTISGGSLNFSGVLSSENTYQSSSIEIGKRYLVTFTISNYTSGGIRAIIGSSGFTDVRTSNGTFTTDVVASGNTTIYLQTQSGTSTYSISNVSVKEYTAADMDVTRATAATRVDENGLVNYAEVLGGEEDIDGNFPLPNTNWTLSGFTISDNKLHCVSDGTYNNAIQSNVFVIGRTYKITFDITGWTLGDIRVRPSGQSPFQLANANGSYTFYYTATNHQIAIERNSACDMYLENLVVKEVTRDNVPRIDYTGGGCPHILAEPQRTNLIPYSSDFSNAVWSEASGGSASNPVLTNDYAISPDGTQNATRCLFDMGGGTTISDFSRLRYLNLTATTPLISIYIKSNNATTYQLNLSYGGDALFLVDAKPNEWTRVDKLTTASGSFDYRLELRGTQTSDDIADVLIWGAQAEEGSYPTSYIPTSGSTVTRNQDIFTRDGIGSLINSTEGVLFLEVAALTITNSGNAAISVSDGSTTNRIFINYSSATNVVKFQSVVGGVQAAFMQYTLTDITIQQKIAFRWDGTIFSVFIDGNLKGSDDRGLSFTSGTLNTLGLNRGSAAEYFVGKVKQLQVFKTALTDTQLAALTS